MSGGSRDVGDESGDMASVMGFSGFGKKARTFDLEAIFEQTRRTAIERTQRTLESRDEHLKASQVESRKSVDGEDDNVGPSAPLSITEGDESDEMIGPPIPPGLDDKSDDDDEDESLEQEIPVSHEIQLEHGNKTVSALTLDPSGARLISGGYDYDIRFWDFAGMDASLRSFRTLQPCECHQIKSVEYSITGDTILVVAGNAQAKVLDRDGFQLLECVKGDQYITDMAKTVGHVGMLNSGCWHPKDKKEFMTCSVDGTVRLWTIKEESVVQKNVIKPRSKNGLRTNPICCAFNRVGQLVASACQDGSIQMWDHRKSFVNTSLLLRDAHINGTETSCLTFSYDDRHLATRGGDDTLKLWDVRMFKKHLQCARGLFNRFPMSDCTFSPNDQMVLTTTSLQKGEDASKLVFYERDTFKQITEINVADTSAVRCVWHPKLNQILVGCGNGFVKVYYSPDQSHRGAKLCVVKTKRKAKQVEMVSQQQIITPHALPLFREERARSTRKQMEKDRMDPLRSRRPDLPMTGPGQGGRIAAAGSTLSSYIIRNLGLKKKIDDEQDPREAILRFAKDAAENPYWVSPAYQSTQPNPIFQQPNADDDKEDDHETEPEFKKRKT